MSSSTCGSDQPGAPYGTLTSFHADKSSDKSEARYAQSK
jgi:hypothetical protein